MAKYLFTNDLTNSITTTAMAEQFPMFGKGHPMYYWADKGLVRYEDNRPGLPEFKKYGFLYWRQAAKRVRAINEMIINSSDDPSWAHERRMMQKFCLEMEDVIKQAKMQGGPTDGGSVLRDYVRRRPKSVVVPQIVDLD